MTLIENASAYPQPPKLAHGQVQLRLAQVVPGDSSRGFVPYYHFRILVGGNVDVGHINFRVGDTEHIRQCAGHIGYEISPKFRGNGFAGQACQALAPFVKLFYPAVTITCDPDNVASRRTIERLGAEFLDEVPVAPTEAQYAQGSRSKQRFRWAV